MKIKVYHGATEVIASPRADIGRPNLDFGQGVGKAFRTSPQQPDVLD